MDGRTDGVTELQGREELDWPNQLFYREVNSGARALHEALGLTPSNILKNKVKE